jgi:hypothetical protein
MSIMKESYSYESIINTYMDICNPESTCRSKLLGSRKRLIKILTCFRFLFQRRLKKGTEQLSFISSVLTLFCCLINSPSKIRQFSLHMPKSTSNVFVVFPILSWGFYVHLSLTFGKLSRTPKRTHEDHAVMKCVILTIFVYSF